MDIEIVTMKGAPLVDRCYVASMVIKSFKGRKNVEVHLFRPEFDPAEADDPKYDWDLLVEEHHHPEIEASLETTKRVILEAFTLEEAQAVVKYLESRYQDKLESITTGPLDLPVPMGMPPLSSIPDGKTIGFIRFDAIPNYTLDFPLRGFYDLAHHEPLVQE